MREDGAGGTASPGGRTRRRSWAAALATAGALAALAVAALAPAVSARPARAAAPAPRAAVRLAVDGRTLAADPPPFIRDGRTLVPLRALFEALGATVTWDPQERAVTAVRGERWVRVRVDRRLACLAPDCLQAALLDVPPLIRQGRTFVPVRFVATALGASVSWDGATRTVRVDTAGGPAPAPSSPVRLAAPGPGAVTGPAELRLALAGPPPAGAAEVRFLLLDPATGRGPVVARGPDPAAAYRWLPDPAHAGDRLLAALVLGADGRFLAGDVVPVRLALKPEVAVSGVTPGQQVDGALTLTPAVNFVAAHVRYELVDPETGAVSLLADADPEAPFTWTPRLPDNGPRTLRVTAYDRLGRAYPGPEVSLVVAVPRRLALTGVAAGAAVGEHPLTLGVSANFPVRATRYLLRDPATGEEQVLAERDGAGRHRWLPSPAQAGARVLEAAVTDDQGQEHRTPPVPVEVRARPALFLETVGPGQVLAGKVELRALANVPLAEIRYELRDERGRARVLARGGDPAAPLYWTPAAGDAGAWRLRAVGRTPAGEEVSSTLLPVRVHAGPTYGPQPVAPRDAFLDLAAGLAQPERERTGMSAALQVAQAILESGWGQSTPADRYTGQPSYNLFGIKGTGPAGSVTAGTWEEYHGVVYRVDAAFRAYRDVGESWADHGRLLLEAPRYAPFRAVMHDPVRGAWALLRAGYATDSRYALKLIALMNRHGLYALDEAAP